MSLLLIRVGLDWLPMSHSLDHEPAWFPWGLSILNETGRWRGAGIGSQFRSFAFKLTFGLRIWDLEHSCTRNWKQSAAIIYALWNSAWAACCFPAVTNESMTFGAALLQYQSSLSHQAWLAGPPCREAMLGRRRQNPICFQVLSPGTYKVDTKRKEHLCAHAECLSPISEAEPFLEMMGPTVENVWVEGCSPSQLKEASRTVRGPGWLVLDAVKLNAEIVCGLFLSQTCEVKSLGVARGPQKQRCPKMH